MAPRWVHAEEHGHPNVLFIAIDDLNDWVGVMGGHPQAITPNIDRLAKRGVLFTNAHCAAPACLPSRTAVMTGIRPSTSGVYRNDQPWRLAMPDAVTLPQYLMQHGYNSVGSGKIFHAPDPPSWNTYYPSKEKQAPDPYNPEGRPLRGPMSGLGSGLDWGPVDVTVDEMADAKVARWVAEQLRRGHDSPFFLGFGVTRPHPMSSRA